MRRRHHRRSQNATDRRGIGGFFRRPSVQIFIFIVLAVVIYLLALGGQRTSLPREVSVDDANQMIQQGALMLDVREQKDWDGYHAPNAIFIPLGQVTARLNEIPHDKKIVVVCSSGECSAQGRDALLAAGFTQVTAMKDIMQIWYEKGYPIEGAPPQ